MTDPTPAAFFNEAAREAAADAIAWREMCRNDQETDFHGPVGRGTRRSAVKVATEALNAALAALPGDELVERVAQTVARHHNWAMMAPRAQDNYRQTARAVLTALGLPVAEREATG